MPRLFSFYSPLGTEILQNLKAPSPYWVIFISFHNFCILLKTSSLPPSEIWLETPNTMAAADLTMTPVDFISYLKLDLLERCLLRICFLIYLWNIDWHIKLCYCPPEKSCIKVTNIFLFQASFFLCHLPEHFRKSGSPQQLHMGRGHIGAI